MFLLFGKKGFPACLFFIKTGNNKRINFFCTKQNKMCIKMKNAFCSNSTTFASQKEQKKYLK